MRHRPASVRARLTIWYSLILGGIIIVFSAGVFFFVRSGLFQQLNGQLDKDFLSVAQAVREEPDELPDLETEGSPQAVRLLKGGQVLFESPSFKRTGLSVPAQEPPGLRTLKSPAGARYRLKTGALGPGLLLTVALEEAPVRRALRTLALIFLLAVPLALGLAACGGSLMAGRLLKPVGVITGRAERISAEDLSARLPVENPRDEFGRLASVFNAMLERLEGAFDRLKRFTADASHELRTPLTVIKSIGEVALQEDLDADAYRDRIGSMLEDVDRLAHLVDDLLTLARADSGAVVLCRKAIDAASLASQAVEDLRPLAEEKGQSLSTEAPGPVMIRADEATLRLALVNLLDNAIKFTPEEGSVVVAVGTRGEEAFIEVADSGPGIAPENRDRIFDRFYRAAKDRPGTADGSGLGLAIAKWAVEANGGRIEWESRESGGTTFRLVFPVLY